MSNSSRPHGLWPTRFLHPWDFPGKSTGVGCHYLLRCKQIEENNRMGKTRDLFKKIRDTEGTFGEGNGTPLQYSCLENPMDRGAWKAAVHGVVEGRTRLSDFTFTFHFHALEKEMATHSSVLACRIPGTGEPGGLPSMGLHRVRHD